MNSLIRSVGFALVTMVLFGSGAGAQESYQSVNGSVKITTGNTYQTVTTTTGPLKSVTIQNNNTNTDNCWVEVTGKVAAGNTTSTAVTVNGVSMTSEQVSILLGPGGSYQRYYPYLPLGAFVATCATSGDTLYVDVQ